MQYKYSKNENYEHFSAGRVLIHKHGCTNFPVRLAQEIFLRCTAYLRANTGKETGIYLYDPCCGSGYMAAVLGFLNPDALRSIVCSDVDADALDTARRNINLLQAGGLEGRILHLRDLYEKYKKPQHLQAIAGAEALILLRDKRISELYTCVFYANVFAKDDKRDFKADIVIADIPYGNMTAWQNKPLPSRMPSANADVSYGNLTAWQNEPHPMQTPFADVTALTDHDTGDMNAMLGAISPVLNTGAVIAVCSRKNQRISADGFIRLEKQLVGKRKFEIWTPAPH